MSPHNIRHHLAEADVLIPVSDPSIHPGIFYGAAAPTNGTSGTAAGEAEPGSLYIATDTPLLHINTNTKASPTWTVVGTQT